MIVGATDKGQKELIASPTAIAKVSSPGSNRSARSQCGAALKWVRNRLKLGDGALGF